MTLAAELAQVAEVAPGLSPAELRAVEDALGRPLPEDLAALWAQALPLGPRWPDWRDDPVGEAQRGRAWVEGALLPDVADGWWAEVLGPRPEAVVDAVEVVVARLAAEPPLVRLRGHRFATVTGGPVLSVYSARASVRCGNDLDGWSAQELGLARTGRAEPLPLPFWDALLGL